MTLERSDILAVDDSPLNLRLLTQLLRTHGFMARSANSGPEALESIRMIPPDLVLLDISMPDMSGFEVCHQIKTHPLTRDIPVIFLTASGHEEDVLHGFSVGAADYLTKPFREAELLARVRTHLELKRHRDEAHQLISDLREALDQVKTLSNLLPICSHCHKVRDDAGYWADVETYLLRHTQTRFSHGICPGCLQEAYPEIADRILPKE